MLDIHMNPRAALDKLLAMDAIIHGFLGTFALIAPHVVVQQLVLVYNHDAHEAMRLYSTLRVATSWIVWNVRRVDDGVFRRHVCEALLFCYVLQVLVVLRAQWTSYSHMNWVAIVLLSTMSVLYGRFRFSKGGNLIKVYELPTGANLQ